MKFIDHTGHIFELPSYEIYPVGYEYETLDYAFTFDDDYNGRLSINNYYIKPIRFVVDEDVERLVINVDSNVFKLLGNRTVQDRLAESKNLVFEIDEVDFTKELLYESDDDKNDESDLVILEDGKYKMFTFYAVAITDEPVMWSSNILIDVKYKNHEEFCPICLSATFYDEQEELIINGQNMGVKFPKDIIRAVYRGSMFNDTINEDLYNEKVKEYLLNYMKLHGECGNLSSAIDGFKFFGWGDKAILTKLVKTDNEFISQYIRDNIDINNDLLFRFEHFPTTGLFSVNVPINAETGETYKQDYSKSFWGEGKPVLEDLFNKLVVVNYDEEDIDFYRPYFDYLFVELGLKLSALKYFYEKYFLPMHSMLQSASLSHQVHLPDIKYFVKDFEKITEVPILLEKHYGTQEVLFPQQNIQYIYTQEHYIDKNLNEFAHYSTKCNESELNLYYIKDLCVSIPIKFISTDIDFFDCHLILERNNRVMWETDFRFSNEQTEYKSFVIIPKFINNALTMNFWENKTYTIHLLCNGKWYSYTFELRVPELQLNFGKLQYKYDNLKFRQLEKLDDSHVYLNANMLTPSLVDVNNINFIEDVIQYKDDEVLSKILDMYRESPSIPHPGMSGTLSAKYYNRVHHYKLQKLEDDRFVDVKYLDEEYNFTDEGELIQSEDYINKYKIFFNSDGSLKKLFRTKVGNLTYDLYLMHDAWDKKLYLDTQLPNIVEDWQPTWYVVLISRETINVINDDCELNAPEYKEFTYNGETYRLQLIGSDVKWLINRMEYIPSNGVNQFNKNDIIAGSITNIDVPFILTQGSHWDIKPFSLKMEEDAHVKSTTNMFLMSLGGDNIGYEPGYYNISVRYSLDGETQHDRTHRARILINR